MKEFKTEIIINAPIEKVWQIFTDFSNYAKWNPFIMELTGQMTVGNKIKAVIQLVGKSPMTFKPVLLNNTFQKEFRWKGSFGIKGLFDGEHYFKFNKLSNDSTQVIQGEIFTGILVKPIVALIGKATLNGFKSMNKALKQNAELFKID